MVKKKKAYVDTTDIKKIAIAGEIGVGKTTLIAKIAKHWGYSFDSNLAASVQTKFYGTETRGEGSVKPQNLVVYSRDSSRTSSPLILTAMPGHYEYLKSDFSEFSEIIYMLSPDYSINLTPKEERDNEGYYQRFTGRVEEVGRELIFVYNQNNPKIFLDSIKTKIPKDFGLEELVKQRVLEMRGEIIALSGKIKKDNEKEIRDKMKVIEGRIDALESAEDYGVLNSISSERNLLLSIDETICKEISNLFKKVLNSDYERAYDKYSDCNLPLCEINFPHNIDEYSLLKPIKETGYLGRFQREFSQILFEYIQNQSNNSLNKLQRKLGIEIIPYSNLSKQQQREINSLQMRGDSTLHKHNRNPIYHQ